MALPSLNPIQFPDLVCTTCAAVMRKKRTVTANGKLDKILYFCDTPKCQYGLSATKEHQNGQNAAYEIPPPPEVFSFEYTREAEPVAKDAGGRIPVPTEGFSEPQLSNEQIDANTNEMLSTDQSDVVPLDSEGAGQPT